MSKICAGESARGKKERKCSIRCVEFEFLVVCVNFAAEYSPFYGIEKSAVLQEARCFNDRELDARRCAQVIARVDGLVACSCIGCSCSGSLECEF